MSSELRFEMGEVAAGPKRTGRGSAPCESRRRDAVAMMEAALTAVLVTASMNVAFKELPFTLIDHDDFFPSR